jgi:CRISPR-associated protein Cmr3
MAITYLQITGLDPIVARDGRPFGDGTGNRMRGLPWPLPSAVAGSARRALVIKRPEGEFDSETIDKLLHVEVAGLFPVVEGKTLFLPAPLNVAWNPDDDKLYRAGPVPLGAGDGCDLPDGLWPVMLLQPPKSEFKPKRLPAWWPVEKLADWLTGGSTNSGSDYFRNGSFLANASLNSRERVCIDAATGAAEESKLFAVSDLTISHLQRFQTDQSPSETVFQPVTLSCRVSESDLTCSLDLYHPLGGNRRLAHWKTQPAHENLWKCPDVVREKLQGSKHVCLMLATPALFTGGSFPGWLANGSGAPPGANGIKLKLVGVVNERWRALSRFALDPRHRGPRPLRRMVPAGSIYFFEVRQGDGAALADRWLQSVCDDEQDRRDGFGLAVWGTWNSKENG